MSQLIYLIIIFILSFMMSIIFFLFRNGNLFKLFLIIVFSLLFTYVCYLYNCFIFNEYVILDILYAIYIAYIVKMYVNKKLKK